MSTKDNNDKHGTSKSSIGLYEFINGNKNTSSLGKTYEKFKNELLKGNKYLRSDDFEKEINAIREAQKVANENNEKFKNEFLDKLRRDLNDKIKKEVQNLNKSIKESKENIKKMEGDFNDKLENSRIKTVETLGIFVALFTFVSVEFQMFRIFHRADSIGGLTSILLGSLISFLLVLDFVIN